MKLSNGLLSVLIALLMLTTLVAALAPTGQADASGPPADGPYDLNLYMYADGNLSLDPTDETQNLQPNQNEKIFSLTDTLEEDLVASSQEKKIRVYFSILKLTGTSVDMYLQNGNTDVAKKENVDISGASATTLWELPFIDQSKSNITFTKGNQIKLKVSPSASATYAYDGSWTGSPAHIVLPGVRAVKTIALATYSGTNAQTLFYPHEEPGEVKTKIIITDSFGADNIKEVNVTIKNPLDVKKNPSSKAATVISNNPITYEHDWSYSTTNPDSGLYSIDVEITDTQGNIYYQHTQFNMSNHGLSFKVTEANINVAEDSQGRFYLVVKNLGGVTSTITLSQQASAGWTVSIENATLSNIPAGGERTATVIVDTTGKSEGDMATITVTAVVSGSPSETKELILTATVIANHAIELIEDATTPFTQTVDFGGNATYKFTVKNTGTRNDKIIITTSHPNSAWTTDLSGSILVDPTTQNDYVSLNAGTQTVLTLRVRAPAVGSDLEETVTITATVDGHLSISSQLEAITRISEGVDISVSPATRDADPRASSATFSVVVKNTGTSYAAFVVQASFNTTGVDLVDWALKFAEFGKASDTLWLNPDAGDNTRTLTLEVKPNLDVSPGVYYIRVQATNQVTARTAIETVSVTVPEIAVATPDTQSIDATARTGETASFSFKLTNDGNSRKEMEVSASGLPSGWHVNINGVDGVWRAFFNPGESKTINVNITLDSDAVTGNRDIVLSTGPVGSVSSQTITVSVDAKSSQPPIIDVIVGLAPIILVTLLIIVFTGVVYRRGKRQA